MRKIILNLAVTLDGFIEGPNGEYDWCFTDQDYGMKQFFEEVDTVIYGRKSYELVTSMEGGLDQFPKMKNYVFSRTLQTAPPEATLVNTDPETFVASIRNEPGKDIWLFGGAELAAAFLEQGLVDVFWLSVHPILLGSGKLLFPQQNSRTPLELIECKAYDSGLVSLKYQRKQ
ncbi:dihydrofolate reductase family protein [Paracnuella aquatica]|uniref:dihydrofolate reductase family protein n=1 Tax=Paracnuella aquatica TaxID=2268757 RepID=UPI000DEF0A4C|nr:dihydrofolate reductase family protein [Paracnuella aquatica]RPD45146.1 dihydrofolate reductase [Paracnuella aquatica]